VDFTCNGAVCGLNQKEQCKCPTVPHEERRASSFLRQHKHNNCYQFLKVNKEGFLNLQLVETLLFVRPSGCDPPCVLPSQCRIEELVVPGRVLLWVSYTYHSQLSFSPRPLLPGMGILKIELIHIG
jgi:hypothetical protein